MGGKVKIKGVTLEQLKKVTAKVSPHVFAKFQEKDGALDGYFQVLPHSPTYQTKKSDGTSHYGPCYHFYSALVQALKTEPINPFTVWLHKHAVTNYTYNAAWKAKTALAKKGFSCAHGNEVPTPAPSFSGVITAMAEPSAPEPPKVTPGKLAEFAPIVGDAVTGGESSKVSDIKGNTRPVYAVVTSLYVLEECKIAALRIPPRVTPDIPDHLVTRALHAVTWRAKVLREADQFAERLARQFFDFCVMACFGEARYGQSGKYTFDVQGMKGSRSDAYQIALRYDPRDLLPKLIHVFNDYGWGGSIGGKKWGNIAKAAALYFKYRNAPIVFVDHCVDLAHNGGLAFNKGYILSNPSDEASYMAMLDEKRKGSIFDSNKSHPLIPAVYGLLAEGIALGLVRKPKTPFDLKDDKKVPTMKWGTDTIKLYDGVKDIPQAVAVNPNPASEVPSGNETYPNR